MRNLILLHSHADFLFRERVQRSLREIRPDYTITRFLGEGSFGVVYEIQNTSGDTLCLKVLATPGTEKPKVLRAVETLGVLGILEREKYPRNLHHANIVDVVESISVSIDDVEIPCVVQKKIEGPTLEELFKESSPEERRNHFTTVAQGIAAGISCVHRNGIAHRDLKPDNIKIDVFGNYAPQIFDFSIAEKLDASGRILHPTPAAPSQKYSAPEGKREEDARRADVWSLGLIFHQYLTGTNPQTEQGLHLQERIIPRRYRAVIRRCLQEDPEKRYKDGDAVYGALQQAEWYYARRVRALIALPAVALALTALPLGFDMLRMRMVSEYTNDCVAAVEKRDLEKAAYSCDRALSLDEESCIPRVYLGHTFFLNGKITKATSAYRTAQNFCSDDRPKDTDLSVSSEIHGLALELHEKGEKQKAIALLGILEDIAGKSDTYSRTLFDILLEEKEYAHATSVFDEMKNTADLPAASLYTLGLWHQEQEHLNKALYFAKGAVTQERARIKKEPIEHLLGFHTNRDDVTDELANYLFLLGNIQFAQGAYEPALDVYQEANSIRPDRPTVFVNIAEIWVRDNNYAGAKEGLRRAEKMYTQEILHTKGMEMTMREKEADVRKVHADLFKQYTALLGVYKKMEHISALERVSATPVRQKVIETEKEMKKYEIR